jgi:prephenate dehydrogenase
MAGKERCGIEEADPDLFRGALCAVVPTAESGTRALTAAEELAVALGATAIRLTPEAHDGIAAVTSHLPHLIASALALTAGEERRRFPDLPLLAAGSFRDTSRVASAPFWLGSDMVEGNREEVCRVARRFLKHLTDMLDLPSEALDRRLRLGAAAREEILREKQTRRSGS